MGNLMATDRNKIIGQNIKRIRKKKELSQTALSKKLGISTVHMSHIECGSVSFSLSLLLDLCEEFDVCAEEIFQNPILLIGKTE